MNLAMTHMRVVSALIVREMSTKFGSKPGGYVWALIEPIGYIAMMTLIFSAIAHAPALGTSFVLFFATGYLGFQIYNAKVSFLGSAVRANKTLLSYPNVAPIDTVYARFILQMMTSTLVAMIVFTGIFLTFHNVPEINWAKLIEAEIYGGALALGVGMFNSVLFVRYALYEQLYGIFMRPMFMVSGVFFLPDSIPHPYREYLLYNPLCHLIMLFRSGFYPEYRAVGLDITYLATFSAIVLFIGMFVFTISRRILRNDG
ncbi:ABC transporter permease [Ensifer sp. OTU672]|uniref:ABC transporter permease n=1 Tax=Ensifer sp. OTU672 TaxID=3043861 RepID=UPI00313F12F0